MGKSVFEFLVLSVLALGICACKEANKKHIVGQTAADMVPFPEAPLEPELDLFQELDTEGTKSQKKAASQPKKSYISEKTKSDDLIVLKVDQHVDTQNYLRIEFNLELDKTQDLDGLISIDDVDNISIVREGKFVNVYYPSNSIIDIVLRISDLVRSSNNKQLGSELEYHFKAEVLGPEVKIPLSGHVLPDRNNLTLPFKAVNLAAVDVEVVKIYSNNVLSFLKENEIYEKSQIRGSGRLIYKQTVRLDQDKSLDLHKWQDFSVDLKNLFKQEKGAIYNIRLSFRKAYSLYNKSTAGDIKIVSGVSQEDIDEWDKTYDYIYREAPDGYSYSWSDEDDPESDTYYKQASRMPQYNLMASNLGLIVKAADKKTIWCAVTDILSAKPLAGVLVTAYNFQLQEIAKVYTDDQGFAKLMTDNKAFIITASDANSTNYLKLGSGYWSTSQFDVSGEATSSDGIKTFIYGERGVWRPGDDIYLSIIVEDKYKSLPANHPVSMDLLNPNWQIIDSQVNSSSTNGIYVFKTKTAEDAPTGLWNARFKVGNEYFFHNVPIETIKPNRLKIKLDVPDILQMSKTAIINLQANWLTGPAASGLTAKLDMSLSPINQPFKEYKDYKFTNPLSSFSYVDKRIIDAKLDAQGKLSKSITVPNTDNVSGMLNANIVAHVEENGGDESIVSTKTLYSPYEQYIGIKLGEKQYETDQDLRFPVVVLNPKGELIQGRKLNYSVYKLNWSWWRESSAYELTRYVQSKTADLVTQGVLDAADGTAMLALRVEYPSWGKYLILVQDAELKDAHITGGIVYIDWPLWRGHSGVGNPSDSKMLSFTLDKKSYETGDVANVYLPAAKSARVLLSVENGSRVISRQWVNLSEKETVVRLPVTKDMAPNFYVNAMLLQPHSQTVNDLPIAMFGIQAAEVVNKSSILNPELELPGEVLPQKEFTVKVKEKDNKPMSYTIAVVDEGLLDITSYRTPQPWKAMNKRQALGIKTWDNYSEVVDAYTGRFNSILSVGGDGDYVSLDTNKEKRFNPVVKFLGPFTLEGGTATHKVKLPMYVGSVRVMLVAAHNGSYGHADKTMTVRAPLMILPSAPRFASCGDSFKLPVNVFVTDKANVNLSLKVEGPVSIVGKDTRSLQFSTAGEQMTEFELKCDKKKQAKAKIVVRARGLDQDVVETIYLDVTNSQPVLTEVKTKIVNAHSSETITWDKTRKASLEFSSIPIINFSEAFNFVGDYSHYCSEQLSSQAMFLLYARSFLGEQDQDEAKLMLTKILKVLASRQLTNGGFAYWPPDLSAHKWVSSMAGEVMLEARRQGFEVNDKCIEKWIKYQKNEAKKYKHSIEDLNDLIQAYRLYTLTLAGERPTAFMNKLRESKEMSKQAILRLAAAYCMMSRDDVANLLYYRSLSAPVVKGKYNTFYSDLRDNAMIVETLCLMGESDKAVELARKVVKEFIPQYYNTQELAFASAAMYRLSELVGSADDVPLDVNENGGKSLSIQGLRGVKSLELNTGKVSIRNNGTSSVVASLTTSYRPDPDELFESSASGVSLRVWYYDLNIKPVSLDTLKQGDEIIVTLKVAKNSNASESMALTYNIPAGWEIWNDRLLFNEKPADNVDIRDSRISWYFSLAASETRTFSFRVRMSYRGDFIRPSIIVEDMYDPRCRAVLAGQRIIVE